MIGRSAVWPGRVPPAADRGRALPRGRMLALGAVLLGVALGFSALRSEILELRYRAAEVLRDERALEEQRRALAVQVRRLRDPRRLAPLARERGFARPGRVIVLGPAAEDAGR